MILMPGMFLSGVVFLWLWCFLFDANINQQAVMVQKTV